MMQGLSPRGGVRRKHGTNVRVDGQKPSREQETQPTFQTRTSRNDEGQSSADSLRQGRLLCISQVLLVFSKFKNLTPLFYLGKNVIGITIACDVTAADLWSATNSMMHKKERIIRMAELYMRQFGWSVGHPTYMEKFCSCERLISGFHVLRTPKLPPPQAATGNRVSSPRECPLPCRRISPRSLRHDVPVSVTH